MHARGPPWWRPEQSLPQCAQCAHGWALRRARARPAVGISFAPLQRVILGLERARRPIWKRRRSGLHTPSCLYRRLREEVPSPDPVSDPSACVHCGAIYSQGRWHWGVAPRDAARLTCPACWQLESRHPAGQLWVEGLDEEGDRSWVERRSRWVEAREAARDPQQRILEIEATHGGLCISTSAHELGGRLQQELANRGSRASRRETSS